MSENLVISGTMTLPNAPGGSTTQILLGTPTAVPGGTSTTVEYEEKSKYELSIAAAASKVVDFGTVADGKFIYIGTDKAITYKLNGGSEVLSLEDEGFMLIKGGGITQIEITAGAVAAKPVVIIVGD